MISYFNLTTPMLEALLEIEELAKSSGPLPGVVASRLSYGKNTLTALKVRLCVVCNGGRCQVTSIGKLVLNAYRRGRVDERVAQEANEDLSLPESFFPSCDD